MCDPRPVLSLGSRTTPNQTQTRVKNKIGTGPGPNPGTCEAHSLFVVPCAEGKAK